VDADGGDRNEGGAILFGGDGEAERHALAIVRAAALLAGTPADPARGPTRSVDAAAYARLEAALAALRAAWVAALREGEWLGPPPVETPGG
jgi:hypothetical protein